MLMFVAVVTLSPSAKAHRVVEDPRRCRLGEGGERIESLPVGDHPKLDGRQR
jgi:hypothetical protein